MSKKSKRGLKLPFLLPLGKIAAFYVPAQKMNEPQFGRDGQTPTQIFDAFFLSSFGGLTHEKSSIQGRWVTEGGNKVFSDQHERYEISFSGKRKLVELVTFLAEMCALLEEDSIYLMIGDRSWLVTPKDRQAKT